MLPENDMVNHLPAIDERYIYKNYMDKSRFYVNYGEIIDIIGDEPWIKSEVHCLCNLSSHRILMLMLGSMRKPITNKGEMCGAGNDIDQIEIDDMVTVSNHGNLFPLAIVKKINSLDKTAKIKWGVSRNTDTVELCHLKKYSVNMTNKQKRKETDFLLLQNSECGTSIKTNDGLKGHSTTFICQQVISSFHLTTIPSCVLKEH